MIHFQLTEQAPIIWLSKKAIFDNKSPIRGGVPICWPWFGPADKTMGDNLPSHGFARINKWSLNNLTESQEGITLEFTFSSNEETLKIWPFEFELTLKATLSDTLKLELITENKGDVAFNYRGALHSYFNISAPENIKVTGLNKEYYNSLKNKQLEVGDTTLLFDQPIDSIYKKAEQQINLEDVSLQRTLQVCDEGNNSEVLWTPWEPGSIAFVDLPDDAYKTMLCIESAITGTEGQQVKAGEKHILSTHIK
ncbi:D-hexose-6-phosphate mutarotase [Psychromonas sp. KJ10-10]|uniref:D-hexose-6-phosphate mutarotase n=1 Tax=Psychromonas sp. KJ10-10 TaxID=3391823 RepID=UPI0039B3AA12